MEKRNTSDEPQTTARGLLCKTYLRHFSFGGRFELEEIAFCKTKRTGNDIRGEYLEFVVVKEDLVVIALPCEGDFIFGAGKLFLQ